ncbi:MAG: hypothetical protein ACYDD7_13075 [Acidimicrobiales bacterium]
MTRRVRVLAVALAATSAALALSACNGVDPLLKRGKAVTFRAPRNGAAVTLPVTVRWSGTLPRGGSYGVMIDAAPPPPGKSIWSLVSDKVGCFSVQLCHTEQNLQAHGADFTSASSYEFSDTTFATGSRRGHHEVTIVILDRDLRRVDENAYTVAFNVGRSVAPPAQ